MKKLIFIIIFTGVLFSAFAINSYLTFDGTDDYAVNTTYGRFRPSDSQGSIVAWVRVNTHANMACVFSVNQTGFSTRFIWFGIDNDGYIYIQQDNADTDDRVISTTTTIAEDADYLICVTSSGTAYALNINGINQGLTVESGANTGDWFIDTGHDNIALGRRSDSSPSNYFNGRIYQVAVYSSTLSASDLLAIYNSGVFATMPATNRVAYWKINEGSSTLIDSDGSINLTVSGATWSVSNNVKNFPKWETEKW